RVFAHAPDLDAWRLRSQVSVSGEAVAAEQSPPAPALDWPARPVPPRSADEDPLRTLPAHTSSGRMPGIHRPRRLVYVFGLGVLVVTALGVPAARFLNGAHQVPTAFRVEGGSLVISGRDNAELWRYSFPQQMPQSAYSGHPEKCHFADFDGDGR